MKLTVSLDRLGNSPENFLHQAGYAMIFDTRRQVRSYVRRLGSGHYPRLHLYFDLLGDKVVFNLHFDQKQVSYEGSHMHSAEYDGEIVGAEVARLRQTIGLIEGGVDSTYRSVSHSQNVPGTSDNVSSINNQIKIAPQHGDWRSDLQSIPPVEKKWWQKIFS